MTPGSLSRRLPKLSTASFEMSLIESLATEICKDLDYDDVLSLAQVSMPHIDKTDYCRVYRQAEGTLAAQLKEKHTPESLFFEYEERYGYVFESKHG